MDYIVEVKDKSDLSELEDICEIMNVYKYLSFVHIRIYGDNIDKLKDIDNVIDFHLNSVGLFC